MGGVTTFLAIADGDDSKVAVPFCSPRCRDEEMFAAGCFFSHIQRDDDSYEFDEVCANCGALVSASN